MTSLAVHLNYNNNNNNSSNNNIAKTTPREKHTASLQHLTKNNADKNNNILSSNTNNNNSNNLNANDLNNNNNNNISSSLLISGGSGIGDSINGKFSNLNQTNNNAKPSAVEVNGAGSNFSSVYNNLKLNDPYGVNVNGSSIESNSNNVSANYALINRIKAFETQQQKNQIANSNKIQRTSNNNPTKIIKQTVFNNTNSNSNSLISARNNPKLNLNNHLIINDDSPQPTFNTFLNNTKNELTEFSSNNNNSNNTNMATMSSQTPTSFERAKSAIRNNGAGSRSASKSQEDFYRYKLKTPSTIINSTNQQGQNVYHDKITDQKFFNRNFKLKPSTYDSTNFNSNSNNLEDATSNMLMMVNGADHTSRINTAVVGGLLYQNEREKSAERIISNSSSFQNPSGNVVLQTHVNNNNNNLNLASVNNQINKLKLLKKRNALKKTLTNTIINQQSAGSSQIPSTTANVTTSNLINSSKEDFKSQTSLNGNRSFTNNNGRPLSMHLSRNSLNNLEQITNSQFSGSNPHLIAQTMIHKSSETIDELVLNEMKLKETDRVKSASRLNNNNNRHQTYLSLKSNGNNVRTKSENELHNINETSLKKSYQDLNYNNNQENEMSYTAYKSLNMNNSFINRMKANLNSAKVSNRNSINLQTKTPLQNSTRLDTSNANKYNSIKLNHTNKIKQQNHDSNNNNNEDNDDYDNVVNDQKEFRIVYPGYNPNIASLRNASNGHNNGIIHTTYINNEMFEISPYNIMSDPVISEQFRRLYDEDEYFQQVHRKVSEWLNKYVFIEMENQTFDRNE